MGDISEVKGVCKYVDFKFIFFESIWEYLMDINYVFEL